MEEGKDEEIHANQVLMVMAYTDDYGIGRLCEAVNRIYCEKYQYPFLSRIFSCEEMLSIISPKLHFTWYKVFLFRQILRNLLDNNCIYQDEASGVNKKIDYLLWIDSDAFVLDFTQPLSSILSQGQYKHLIIAEDLHPCCLINAGVFFLRVDEWSYSFLEEVWNTEKYDKVFYYEQSAFIKVLQRRKERLEKYQPFHSFVAHGPQAVKIFAHVAVFPHFLLSSSHVISKAELAAYENNNDSTTITIQSSVEPIVNEETRVVTPFICHAAGVKHKLHFLLAAIHKYSIPLPDTFSTTDIVFRLRRNGLGHYIPPVSNERDYSEQRRKKEVTRQERMEQLEEVQKQEEEENSLGFDALFQV